MKNYYEAPNNAELDDIEADCIFLGGSITGAYDWQKGVAEKLTERWTVFNPRRGNYDKFLPEVELEQIAWEHTYLELCNHIIFYFDEATVAPITLFEYGKYLTNPSKTLYVVVHPNYSRKNDIEIQSQLCKQYEDNCASVRFFKSLDELTNYLA